MRDKVRDGILYAYYGGLLNGHQREIMRLYCDCDMSLAEISQDLGITRQGVREIIVRSVEKLDGYESKLGLVSKIRNVADDLSEIIAADGLDENVGSELKKVLTKIEEM